MWKHEWLTCCQLCNKQILKQIKKDEGVILLFSRFFDFWQNFIHQSKITDKKLFLTYFSQAGRQLFLFASTKTSEEKTKTLFWKPESSVKEFNAQVSTTNLKNCTLWKTTAPSKPQIWCSPALLHPNSFHISHVLHFENATGMSPNWKLFRVKNYLSSHAL